MTTKAKKAAPEQPSPPIPTLDLERIEQIAGSLIRYEPGYAERATEFGELLKVVALHPDRQYAGVVAGIAANAASKRANELTEAHREVFCPIKLTTARAEQLAHDFLLITQCDELEIGQLIEIMWGLFFEPDRDHAEQVMMIMVSKLFNGTKSGDDAVHEFMRQHVAAVAAHFEKGGAE